MNTTITKEGRRPTVLAELRALMPNRPVTRLEALFIAEHQASKLLALTHSDETSVPEAAVAELPRLTVERHSPLGVSGGTAWVDGRWQIVLNGAEPLVRQRFSLFHEFKHIIDHPFVPDAYRSVPAGERDAWTERLCDYFAACALMPKARVKSVFCNDGEQDVAKLARRFAVSQMAMRVRLLQLNLIDPAPRCRYRRVSGRPTDALDIYIIQPLRGSEVTA